jgi:hypothetical protein
MHHAMSLYLLILSLFLLSLRSVCDLAEWGVVIDDAASTKKMMSEYWDPMWKVSFTGKDVDVQDVMDGLKIDRDGEATGGWGGGDNELAAATAGMAHGATDVGVYDDASV